MLNDLSQRLRQPTGPRRPRPRPRRRGLPDARSVPHDRDQLVLLHGRPPRLARRRTAGSSRSTVARWRKPPTPASGWVRASWSSPRSRRLDVTKRREVHDDLLTNCDGRRHRPARRPDRTRPLDQPTTAPEVTGDRRSIGPAPDGRPGRPGTPSRRPSSTSGSATATRSTTPPTPTYWVRPATPGDRITVRVTASHADYAAGAGDQRPAAGGEARHAHQGPAAEEAEALAPPEDRDRRARRRPAPA